MVQKVPFILVLAFCIALEWSGSAVAGNYCLDGFTSRGHLYGQHYRDLARGDRFARHHPRYVYDCARQCGPGGFRYRRIIDLYR